MCLKVVKAHSFSSIHNLHAERREQEKNKKGKRTPTCISAHFAPLTLPFFTREKITHHLTSLSTWWESDLTTVNCNYLLSVFQCHPFLLFSFFFLEGNTSSKFINSISLTFSPSFPTLCSSLYFIFQMSLFTYSPLVPYERRRCVRLICFLFFFCYLYRKEGPNHKGGFLLGKWSRASFVTLGLPRLAFAQLPHLFMFVS